MSPANSSAQNGPPWKCAAGSPGGQNGTQTSSGAGGGGSGGHVRIECNHMQTAIQVYCRGGNGGDSPQNVGFGQSAGGEGASGAGGFIYVYYSANNGFIHGASNCNAGAMGAHETGGGVNEAYGPASSGGNGTVVQHRLV